MIFHSAGPAAVPPPLAAIPTSSYDPELRFHRALSSRIIGRRSGSTQRIRDALLPTAIAKERDPVPHKFLTFVLLIASFAKADELPSVISASDWPWWRGPQRNGVADANQELPLNWAAGIVWKVPVPGRGHASPTVFRDCVYLPTADEQALSQSVICFSRVTGKQIWSTQVHQGRIERKGNKRATQASASIACDGERLFITFMNSNAVHAYALDLNGKPLWRQTITDYVTHQGYGASPAIYGPFVLVAADNKAGGSLMALRRENGEIMWKRERPKKPNYPSPIILQVAGRDQLLMTGCDLVTGLNPLTGQVLWEVDGATTECVTSTVTDGKVILTSGGYPDNHMSAVRADGSGEVVWRNKYRVYVPSCVVADGILYAVTDAGVALCLEMETGKELWKSRLGGTMNASLTLVGDRLVAIEEEGTAFIYKANPEKFELVAKNHLGEEVFATPTICGGHIYARVAEYENGKRQEYLYAIGEK